MSQPDFVVTIFNKQRKILVLLTALLVFGADLFAQTRNNDYPDVSFTKDDSWQSTWQVYLKPLALVDPVTGTLQAGLQKDINSRFAVALDYGLKLPALSYYYRHSERQNYRYAKSSLEVKYYLRQTERRRTADRQKYVALQAFYFPQRYVKTNDFLTLNGATFHYEKSDIKRTVFAYNLETGYQLYKRRFAYSVYTGFGFRTIELQQKPEGLQPGLPSEPVEIHIISLDRQQGSFVRLNFLLGVRIGYRFR